MSKYYMLECYMPVEWDDMAMFEGVGSWRLGRRFTTEPPNPVIVKIKQGYPNGLKEMYNNDAIIITKKLSKTLQQAGVDNLDIYPCVIVNESSGFSTDDYVAVNLIGLVKAVDLDNSNITGGSSDHLLDTDFDGLTIDPKKAKDHLMFRLAENTSAIIIHETVSEHLLAKGFDMLTYVEPKDWIG